MILIGPPARGLPHDGEDRRRMVPEQIVPKPVHPCPIFKCWASAELNWARLEISHLT
jgi:hypothetical protein